KETERLTAHEIRLWHQAIAESPARLRSRSDRPANVRAVTTSEDHRKRRATANRVLTILKAALTMALQEGRAVDASAPWTKVKAFKGVDSPRIRYLDLEEAKRLLAACETDFQMLVRG